MRLAGFLLCGFLFLGVGCSSHSADNRVCMDKVCVDVELARTPDEQEKGLMYRSSLAEDRGMLFIFSEIREHNFWMKNTLIPLDIIWFDQARKIIHIESHVPPCTADPCPVYGPQKAANYVLEVNAGFAERHKIRAGETVKFDLKKW